MTDVEEKRVDYHEHAFEDPEEPFVSQDWGKGGGVKVRVEVKVGGCEVFDRAEDCTGAD